MPHIYLAIIPQPTKHCIQTVLILLYILITFSCAALTHIIQTTPGGKGPDLKLIVQSIRLLTSDRLHVNQS